MGSWFTTAQMPAIYTFSQCLTPFFYLFVRNPGQRWLVVQSQERRESDLGKLSQRITKAQSKAVEDFKKLSPEKFACEADAIKGCLNYSNQTIQISPNQRE
jgi:transposase